MKLSINIFIEMFSIFSTIFLAFFITIASLINQDIKAIIYFGWAGLAMVLTILLVRPLVRGNAPSTSSQFCDLFKLPLIGDFVEPSLSSVYLAFSIVYFLFPMFYFKETINYPFALSLFILFGLNVFHRMSYQCNRWWSELILAPIVGLIIGLIAIYTMVNTNNQALLYYDELVSNKQACGRPQKQYYKCEIKGGSVKDYIDAQLNNNQENN
tara:strand:+ start:6091 stop:6726 length:636 start_codon:yes stop_codon:yes gene_type:complete